MPQDPTGQLPTQPKADLGLDEFEEKVRERYQIPKGLWSVLADQESGGDVNAVSPTGVRGRRQVTRATARGYGLDRDDPFEAAVAAAKNLREGYDRYKDQFDDDNKRWLAASAYYYRGPSAVKADGTFETSSADGLSTAANYVTDIAKKWKAFNDNQAQAADQMSRGLLPGMKEPTSTPARQSQADKQASRVKLVSGQLQAMEGFANRGERDKAREIAAGIKRRFGDLVEIKEVAGAFGVNPKPGVNLQLPAQGEPARKERPITAEEYNALPWYQRRLRDIQAGKERAGQAMADAAMGLYDTASSALRGDFRPLGEQLEGAGRGILAGAPSIISKVAGGPLGLIPDQYNPLTKTLERVMAPVTGGQEAAIKALQGRQAERRANDPYWQGSRLEQEQLAAEEAAAPGLPSMITRGVTSGGLQAPLYMGASMAGGPAGAAALAAAQSDFTRPQEAAVNIAGAVLPIKLGRGATPAINRVAAQLPGRALPALTRAGGQMGVGAATNVATALAAGERDPRRLIEQGASGALLSSVDALTQARAGRTPVEVPTAIPDATGTPAQPINGVRVFRQGEQIPPRSRAERQVPIDITNPDGSVETVLAVAPRGMNETAIRQAAEQSLQAPQAPTPTFDDVIADSQARIAQHLTDGDTNAVDIELSVLDQTINDQYKESVKAAGSNPAARAAAQRVRAQQQRVADGIKRQAAARVSELAQPTEQLQAQQPEPTQELTEPLTDSAATQRTLPTPPALSRPTDRLATQRVRTPEGALMVGAGEAPKSPLLLGPAATQQIPGRPRTAPPEPTAAMTQEQTPQPTPEIQERQTVGVERAGNGPLRRTAEIPREQPQPMTVSTTEPQQPQPARPGRPTTPVRPALSVPRATDANIAELEARYEQLLRARYDKGAPLTGDLRLEEQALGAEIMRYRNERAPRGETEPMSSTIGGRQRGPSQSQRLRDQAGFQRATATEEPTSRVTEGAGAGQEVGLRRYSAPLEGQPIEIPERGPRTSGLLQSSVPGRPVTQEIQIPSSKNPRTDFYSREDARRGYFDTLTDNELVQEISRLEDVKANAIRGRSKMTPEEIEANNFDLKIAVEQQKERTRTQIAQGREPGERIANRTPGQKLRVIQHERYGQVTESPNQKGVPAGKIRVTDTGGAEHIIQNPRTRGNRTAAFVKPQEQKVPTESLILPPPKGAGPIPDTAMPEVMEQRAQRLKVAVGKSAEDQGKVKVSNLGLQSKMAPSRPANARAKQKNVNIDDITLGRDDLSKGRMFQVREALRGGVKPPKRGVPLAEQVEPIVLVPDPQRPGKYIVSDDGNHRVALLKLQGFKGQIPTTVYEAPRPRGKQGFSIGRLPDESSGGTVLGSLGGGLQGAFKNRKPPKANPTKADIEGASLGKAAAKVFQRGQNEVRALWTSMDFSAPFSQGAILTLAHPIKGANSAVKMVRSLSRAQSDAIDAEIAFHPLRKLGEESGLYLATGEKLKGAKTGTEEAHGGGESVIARQIGFRHSERAYRTYLDTLRLATWESYVKALQADGHTFQNNPKAYKDAAAFINIATGRGQLRKGGSLEKASDLMGNVLFAPRNMIANFQVLDPVRYASLAPGARKVVLRDALKAFGVMIGTAALLKANGAQVSFDPTDSDFLTARLGNTRYDLTFGKKTQVQFLARMAKGLYNQATGEGNLPGKDPLSVLESFASNKLSPVLGTAKTFLTGKDATGEKVADKSKAMIAWETAAPMLWRDLVEAYREEGKMGVVKTLPTIVGARVNTYPDRAKSDFIATPPELRAEQKKFGETRSVLTPKRGEDMPAPPAKPALDQIKDVFRYQGPKPLEPGKETPGQFAARKARADEWNTKYGLDLVRSDAYRSATAEEKKAAIKRLEEVIAGQSDEKQPKLYMLRPEQILQSVRASAREKRRKASQASAALQ